MIIPLTHGESITEEEKFNQERTPYFDALKGYIESGVTTFHVPGHIQGKGAHPEFRDFVKKYGLEADVSQVLGLDDIHQPGTVVKEAQDLAAKAYNADKTYFLINGSSSGNHAMILSVLNPGDKILLPRNMHRSTTGALILSGAIPVYMDPAYDYDMQVDHAITTETMKETLEKNQDVKAVMVLSPTYYGATCNVKEMVEIAHSYNKPILVDEAWGPHFHFHPSLPMSATEAGADLCVNSTHKLVGGMCQASMIHAKGNRIDVGRLESVIRLFLSTSPSCLMVASLDMARMNLAMNGKKLLDRALELSEWARNEINKVPGLKSYGYEMVGRPGVHAFDGTKLNFTAKDIGYTGYEVEQILRKQYNLQIEMSDLFNCLALITIGHNEEDVTRLVNACRDVNNWDRAHVTLSQLQLFYRRKDRPMELPDWSRQIMTPREAFVAEYETIDIKDSGGRVCAEMITPYPPGIPILRPGDEITDDIVDHIRVEIEAGVHIQGAFDPTLRTIRVVK
jgi:arginine/lysine/ornithine decarboxylase